MEPIPLNTIELIFLGTGTSSSLPHVECLTAEPGDKQCHTCLSTLTPEGKKNIRRNTSAVLRMDGKDGQKKTIVIDVGKNFQAAALEWFPKYGLRRIDAVLITHAHADAMNGLDDLRGWTLNSAIQHHIDVYVSQTTFTEVQRSFPYLASKEFASGGGDVPEFKWHIIHDKIPFEIEDTGIQITPFAVHHGRLFSANPPLGYTPTPNATVPSSPSVSAASLPLPNGSVAPAKSNGNSVIHPLLCLAFKIQDAIIYMSDVSFIPEDVWLFLEDTRRGKPIPVCVLDCLRLQSHTSHFGFGSSIANARRIGASRTYLTGFGHEVSHSEYVTMGEVVGGKELPTERLSSLERRGLELVDEGEPIWVRPAHDGLRVLVSSGNSAVIDESY